MSSSSEKRRGASDGEQKLLDLLQPSDRPAFDNDELNQTSGDDSVAEIQLPLQSRYGNAAVARKLIQRKAEGEETSETASSTSETQPLATETHAGAEPGQTSATSLIVEDNSESLGPGQMKKSQFLAELKASVCSTATRALAGTPFSAEGCPNIEYWFAHYAKQNSDYIEKAVRRYVPEAAGATTAQVYISLINARVNQSVATWVHTGEITGIPPGVALPSALTSASGRLEGLASGVSGVASSVGAVAAGIASGAGTVASGIGSGLSSAISGLGSLLFKERDGGATEGADPQAVQNSLGAGEALDAGVRVRMEQAFGESLSGVQVHTDTRAARVSENLNARALTVGDHIAFGEGEYQPGNLVGEALLAHELAHVLQQRGAGQTTQKNEGDSSNSSVLEEAADQSAVGAVIAMWGGQKFCPLMVRNAMPKLRSGLRLSRCKSSGKKPEPAPEPIPADPHAEYEKRLKEAIDKLSGARFGLCYDRPTNYDTDYWTVESDPEFGSKLSLKAGKRPSDAIDAMFADLGKWSVDCAQFVQIAEWYALRHAYGADEFNKRAGLSFDLRVHRSTGIKYKDLYERTNRSAKMTRRSDGAEEPRTVEQILTDAPIGSRVTWTNPKAPSGSPFYNENTIKLGTDQFAAHGFGGSKNIFTRAEVELLLARAENPSADAAYVAANIFISQIGYFETP
jgi:hypothetical protein